MVLSRKLRNLIGTAGLLAGVLIGWSPENALAKPEKSCPLIFESTRLLQPLSLKKGPLKDALRTYQKARKKRRVKADDEVVTTLVNRLRALGFETSFGGYLDDDDEYIPAVEITGFSKLIPIGTVMKRVRERFKTKFYIDPVLNIVEEDQGFFDSEHNFIVLDWSEFEAGLAEVPTTFLHEVRHLYFWSLLNERASLFHGEIDTEDDDYRLGEHEDFYDDYVSLEELSTMRKDVRVGLRRLQNGTGDLQAVLSDAVDLADLAKIIRSQLKKIRFDVELNEIDVKVAKNGRTCEISYPIYEDEDDQDDVSAYVRIQVNLVNGIKPSRAEAKAEIFKRRELLLKEVSETVTEATSAIQEIRALKKRRKN